jgi:hypothetical protein
MFVHKSMMETKNDFVENFSVLLLSCTWVILGGLGGCKGKSVKNKLKQSQVRVFNYLQKITAKPPGIITAVSIQQRTLRSLPISSTLSWFCTIMGDNTKPIAHPS